MSAHLQPGTLLKSPTTTYTIREVLGQGSFGITYRASMPVTVKGPLGDITTSADVCIKEFFMQDFNTRRVDGTVTSTTDSNLAKQYGIKFSREAVNLSHLNHDGIVRVLETFDTKGTHYYVMEYIEGETLDSYASRKGGIPEREALADASEIATALDYMHSRHMLHLDLKPKNVMRRGNEAHTLTLIDFGLSKQYEASGEPESSTTIGLGTPGYAPPEQGDADDGKDFQATLDIYALGATLFKLLTGETPPKASRVLNEGLPVESLRSHGVTRDTISLIQHLMQPRRLDRPQSMRDVLAMLSGNTGDVTSVERESLEVPQPLQDTQVSANQQTSPRSNDKPKVPAQPKKSVIKYVLMGIVTLLVAVAGLWVFNQRGGISDGNTSPIQQVTDTTLNISEWDYMRHANAPIESKITFTGTVDKTDTLHVLPVEGTATYADGRVYQGKFENGLRSDSNALLTLSNGDTFRGQFVEDHLEKGRYTVKEDGYYFEGTYDKNQPWTGKWYSPDGTVDSEIKYGREI